MICRAGRSVSPVVLSAPEIWPSAPIQVVLHQFASLLDSHAFALAEFGEQSGVFLALGIVRWIHNRSLVDILQAPLFGELVDVGRVADENDVCDVVSQYLVGCLKSAFLFSFRKHDALLVCFGARYNLL